MPLPRPLRYTPTLALALALAGCGGSSPIALSVIAPDGGDPFLDPDGANLVRVIVEDDVTQVPVTAVQPNGAFEIEVKPVNNAQASRVRVEALRGEERIGSGATPPMVWASVEGQRVAVLMHYNDTIVPGPVTLSHGRRDFELYRFGDWGFLAFANPPGTTEDLLPSGYSVLQHARLVFDQPVPAVFDGDTAVLEVANSWFLQRGSTAGRYTNSNVAVVRMDIAVPAERQLLLHPAAVRDPYAGGGLLLGGRDPAGAPSARVDRVSYTMEFEVPPQSTLPPALSTPREHPDVVTLQVQTSGTTQPQYLVSGGQRADQGTLLELYEPGSALLEGHGNVVSGEDALDHRTGAAAVCIKHDTNGCELVLIVGGRDPAGGPSRDNVVVSTDCARRYVVEHPPMCATPLIVARDDCANGNCWLSHRRWGARVAVAEGGMVLVAGGQDENGPVHEVETIDVRNPMAPAAGRVLMSYDAADPAVMSLTNGDVVVAGGTLTDPMSGAESASAEVWFYRY